MLVQPQDIRFCLDKTAEIVDQYLMYVLNGRAFHRSVDDLEWICSTYLETKIYRRVLHKLPAANSSVRGLYVSSVDGYEIYVLADMNFCWNRFVISKELFHVVMDTSTDEYRDMDLYKHLKDIALSFPETHSIPGKSAVSELLAEIAAVEFLFPYKERLYQQGNSGQQINYPAIAEHYKLPLNMVEKYMSKSWMDYLGAFFPRPAAE